MSKSTSRHWLAGTAVKPTGPASVLATFAREEDDDQRTLGWAVAAAALLHLGLFILTFPELSAEIEEPEPATVWVMSAVRFQPPAPPETAALPEPRVRRVPVPDPTPESPEPIRVAATLDEPPIALPEAGLLGLPTAPPPPDSAEPLRICCGPIVAPVATFSPQPRYTEIARQARVEGSVIVEAIIDSNGVVTGAKILKGLSFGLDEAALETLRRWRFEPATRDGRPVPVVYNLTVAFSLR